jgi:branched-chain amino acid transport system permease protein
MAMRSPSPTTQAEPAAVSVEVTPNRLAGATLRIAAPLVLVAFGISVPLLTSSAYNLQRLDLFLIYCLPAMALNFASGLGGQLALGEPVIMGAAAYTTAILTTEHGYSEWWGLLIGIAVAMALSLLLGLPGLRVRGWYLAILTFFAIGIFPSVLNIFQSETGGGNGLVGIPPLSIRGHDFAPWAVYEVSLVAVVVVWLGIRNIAVGSWGGPLRELRDHPRAAQACGVEVTRVRLQIYLLIGVICGLAGWLFAHTQGVLEPANFSLSLILLLIGSVFLGGEGSLWGPIVGVAIFETISLAIGPFSIWNSFILGCGVLASAIAFRGGVVGTLRRLVERWRAPLQLGDLDRISAAARQTAAYDVMAASPPQGGPVLTVRGLSKAFGGNRVLEGVDLQVARGELLGLIGPNGSGKTTLLNAITGVEKPDGGSVELNGREITGASASAVSRAGMRRTFQQPQLVEELTVLENIRIGVSALSRPKLAWLALRTIGARRVERESMRQAREICALLHLPEPFLHAPVSKLPLGMKRVVEAARSLVGESLIVCLDEPAAGLNGAERDVLVELLLRMKHNGVSLLLIEHNLELVMQTCDHVILLEDGAVTAAAHPRRGEVDAHLRDYLSAYEL